MATFVSDEEFLRTWEQFKSPTKVANALNVSVRGVYERRDRMEQRMGIVLKTVGDVREKNGETNKARLAAERNAEVRATCIENIINATVANGTVVIFSDAHYWPGEPTVAHTALVKVIKQLKPDLVIANGDLFDGARISRHPRAGWE